MNTCNSFAHYIYLRNYGFIKHFIRNIYNASSNFPEFVDIANIKCHEDVYKFSLDQRDTFWGRLARSRLNWYKEFDIVSNCNLKEGKINWFSNGKLNASENCIDRHLDKHANQIALIWEKDEPGSHEVVTYRQLSALIGRIANVLRNAGVKRGDVVSIYLPMAPVTIATMLACARIGAVHSVVFAGFSPEALASRILDCKSEILVTADEGVRGGRIIPLKRNADIAVGQCPEVRQVIVYQRTYNDVPMGPKDILLSKAMEGESDDCTPEQMDSEDPLFMLYTSGSTGKPKGILHSTAGYLLYANVTFKHVFDYQPGEKFGCVADIGWVTGHSYVLYGPLSNGATTLIFESTPIYPDAGRYWEMVERLKLNHIYLAPTSLRLLLRAGDSWVNKYDLSSLRKLGCVGEPLNHEAWQWYHTVVGKGRCDVIDTWWQTETGGICIAPRPSDPGAAIRPSMPMRPFFGIKPTLMSEQNEELHEAEDSGMLCIDSAWPGMARTIFGDHQRFIDTYMKPFPGMFYTGDGACRHDGGIYQITGRIDDIVNVSGHRLGTAELEDIMDDHPDISETAVVGFPHDVKGEGIFAFAVKKNGVTTAEEKIARELRQRVKQGVASFAQPDLILFTNGLPWTRSGKIMRRILRKIAADQSEDLGDISTLANPSVVAGIVDSYRQLMLLDKK